MTYKSLKKGFTLIELMITVAVIVTLAVVGGPPLANTLRKPRGDPRPRKSE